MERLPFTLSFLALLLAASLALSCGANQSQSKLQSLAVNPSNANAQSYPNGEVPFIATGYYSNPTHTLTPQSANWVACQKGLPTTDVAVTTAGVAKCVDGAVGAYAINAWDIPTGAGVYNCTAITACGGGCTVEAAAQLTCP
ncbi:MAG: hypothetical protein WBX02_12905 [Terriglobales bacterium]